MSFPKRTCRSWEERQEFYIQPDDLFRRLSAARAPPTSHPMLHTLEETLDAVISTIERSRWLEAGHEDACRQGDEKGGKARRSPQPIVRQSITWNIDPLLCCMCPDRLSVQARKAQGCTSRFDDTDWRRTITETPCTWERMPSCSGSTCARQSHRSPILQLSA